MHTETFEEINIDKALITNYDLMADGQIVEVMFHTEKETVLSAELPPIVDMEVTYTEPGVKGDTASTNSLKPATVNTGATVRVQASVMGLGQAAGAAAAQCVRSGVGVAEIDVGQLRKTLVEYGANLTA